MFVVLAVDHTRCNAWVLDGDLYHKGLQKFAMCVENLADSLALLVVDLSRPWLALDSLHKWTSVLRDYLDKLRVPPETMRELELGCTCVCSLFFSHKHLSASGVKTNIKTSLHSRTPVCSKYF